MTINDLLRRFTGDQYEEEDEEEWEDDPQDDGSDDEEEARYRKRRSIMIALGVVAAIIIAIALSLTSTVEFYTDLLWYESHSFDDVMWTRIWAQFGMFGAVAAVALVALIFNWRLAARIGNRAFAESMEEDGAELIKPIIPTIVAIAVASVIGFASAARWETALGFFNGVPFGESDPVFGEDVGFFIFTLPFIDLVISRLIIILVASAAGSAVIYLLCRPLRMEHGKITIVPAVKFHILALVSLCAFALAIGFWMDRYDLLYSPTGIVFGMGYTDMYIMMPALALSSAAAAICGVLLLVNFFRPIWKISIAIVVAFVAISIIGQQIVPSIVQSYIVQPNEFEREREFIDRHIKATRLAYSLDDVRAVQVTPDRAVTATEISENKNAVSNIRLWDYSPLLRTYKQLQQIRSYYDFNDVDIDRYDIDGTQRQVMLSVRELDLSSLQNRTWVNSHLEFTHGYGVVMNPVNEIESSGLPVFFMKDLPPRTSVPIKIDRPEIYYGEMTDDYALVKTNVREFDYPVGDSNARSTYAGEGGVEIGSFMRKLLFAIRFHDSEIIFTDALTSESRVLFNRNVKNAIREIAPFLLLDDDAYPVISEGKIFWVQDAYTYSDSYPYSLPLSTHSANRAGLGTFAGVNYIRNSVKIVVDAYSGAMKFYVVDDSDPIIRCWRGIFPTLFTDVSEASDDMRSHFRYPEEYFQVQSEIYRTYHMTDANTFYNREDVWMTSPTNGTRQIRPNYVTMELIGEKGTEFTIVTPFMPMGRSNLIGWMAGRCDGDRYGELIVYQFPKQELIYGPPQIDALIDQNTTISSQLSLWSQHGSDVIRGDLLVIPIGKSLLYVQPLYLRAERGELPELKRIILSTGGRLAWGETFDEAITALFGSGAIAQTPQTPTVEQSSQPNAGEQMIPRGNVQEMAVEARRLYEEATRASRRGDWAEYGRRIDELGALLEELAAPKLQEQDRFDVLEENDRSYSENF